MLIEEVLGPLCLYAAGCVLVGSIVVRLVLERLRRPAGAATALLVGLTSSIGLTLVGLTFLVIAPS